MGQKVKIISKSKSSQELKHMLEKSSNWDDNDITLEVKSSMVKTRGMDTTLLVAIVGAVSTGLGGLIAALSQIVQQYAKREILLQSKNGAKIIVPANTSLEEIDCWIEKLKKMDDEVSKVLLP